MSKGVGRPAPRSVQSQGRRAGRRSRNADADAAASTGEQAAYQTMSALLAQIGTACSTAADAVSTLRGMPEPAGAGADNDGDKKRADLVRLIATNCAAASEALRTVVQMATEQRDAAGGSVVTLDGKGLLGADGFEDALTNISEVRLQSIIAGVITKQLLRVTHGD
jgi:hypothetical protein